MVSRDMRRYLRKPHTHHDSTVETLRTDRNDDVAAVPFENLATRNHEAVRVREHISFLLRLHAFLVADFSDSIGFTGSPTLIATNVVPGEEDTVARDNFTRLYQRNVADDDLTNINDPLNAATDDLNSTLFLLFVQCLELTFLLPVVQ